MKSWPNPPKPIRKPRLRRAHLASLINSDGDEVRVYYDPVRRSIIFKRHRGRKAPLALPLIDAYTVASGQYLLRLN